MPVKSVFWHGERHEAGTSSLEVKEVANALQARIDFKGRLLLITNKEGLSEGIMGHLVSEFRQRITCIVNSCLTQNFFEYSKLGHKRLTSIISNTATLRFCHNNANDVLLRSEIRDPITAREMVRTHYTRNLINTLTTLQKGNPFYVPETMKDSVSEIASVPPYPGRYQRLKTADSIREFLYQP